MYEDIKQQFKSVISYSQNIPDPKVDVLFREWETNKEKFINRFGGLIYEWSEPIEFTLDDAQKRQRAMEFATTVSDTFNNPTLAEFIDNNLPLWFDDNYINNIIIPKTDKIKLERVARLKAQVILNRKGVKGFMPLTPLQLCIKVMINTSERIPLCVLMVFR